VRGIVHMLLTFLTTATTFNTQKASEFLSAHFRAHDSAIETCPDFGSILTKRAFN
jgi:hypothetical protein